MMQARQRCPIACGHRVVFGLVVVPALFWWPAGAVAAEKLDQSTGVAESVGQAYGGSCKYMAQSFKPGDGMGRLLRVELWLERDNTPPNGTLTLSIRDNTSSQDIVAKGINPADLPDVGFGQWFSIDMTLPEGKALSPQSTYWLVLQFTGYSASPRKDVVWFYAKDAYGRGGAYYSSRDTPAWPPPNNWTSLEDQEDGDLAFRTYSDDGWTDVNTVTEVSEDPDPISHPTTSTTVKVKVTGGGAAVPGGSVTLSVSPKEGTFAGGGSGPVTLSLSSGEATISWTAPLVKDNAKTYTFSATYPSYSHSSTKKVYKESTDPDTLTVNPVHAPVISDLSASLDNRDGNDIGIFIGGLSGQFPSLVVNNTFTATVTDQENDLTKVEFFIDGVLRQTNTTGPYQYTHDMSSLGTSNATLKIKATDGRGLVTEVTRTILTVAPPPWLFKGVESDPGRYVLNPQPAWNAASGTYTFTGKIPNNPALYKEQTIDFDYLGTLHNIFESDIDVVETFTTSGDWTYSVNGVLNATVLDVELLGMTFPGTITKGYPSPSYARGLERVTWSREFDLFDKSTTVYEGIIASFNVLGIQFDVKLTVDFGFNATVTISASLGSALTPDNITVAPTLSPYVKIKIELDILWGTATVGAEITPTFSYTLPLVYSFTHVPRLYWDDACLEFVLKAQFYVDLLWGAGHWESDEEEYGHKDWPEGCSGEASGAPPGVGPPRPSPQQSTRLKLFQAPSLAFDAHGNGLALWIHDNDPTAGREDPEVYYAVFQAGAWGPPQRLTNNQRFETDPKVAFVGNNQAVAVWTYNTLTEAQGQAATSIKQVLEAQDLWYSTWNAGVWTAPAPLTNDVGAVKPSDGRVVLAGDPGTSSALATWVRDADGDPNTTNDWDIYYSVWRMGPGWGPRTRLGPANAVLEAEPDVSFAPNGTATCAWVKDNDGDAYTNGDRSVMYSQWNGAVWSAPAALPPPAGFPPPPPPQGMLWPSVTHDANSNPVIVFTSRKQDPSGGDAGEGFKDRLWWARRLGGQWLVWPSGMYQFEPEGQIVARWPVAKRRPDNFIQVVYRTDDETGLDGFDGDVGNMVIDVRGSGDDFPGRVPSNDDVLDWQIDMDVDGTGNVQILWVREGSNYPGAPFGSGYDDLMLIVLPTGMPNLALPEGSVTLSDPYPATGANVTVTAKVANLNAKEAATPFPVGFYLDSVAPGNLLGTQAVTYVGPNSETSVQLTFPTPAGSHLILAVADSTNAIPETDEGDNTGSVILWYQAPPTQLEAYPDPSTGGIDLTWQPSAMPTITGYRVYRSTTSGSAYALLGSTAPDVLVYCDTDVEPARDYYYVVKALDPWAQESGASNEADANVGPDTDSDGSPDMSDQDDDDDGMPDAWETTYALDPLDPADAEQDADGDTLANLVEYQDGTDPRDANSHRDITAPTLPGVTDDGAFSDHPSALHATWSASDPESGIAEYQYAVGTTAGGTNVLGWTSADLATEATAEGLSLTDGQTYYISVKARNGAGLWSSVGSSNGIVVDASLPTAPVVNDGAGADVDCHSGLGTLSANWSASDPHSGIVRYSYSVENGSGSVTVVPWTDAGTATSVALTGLSLVDGETYRVRVVAENGAGLTSVTSMSDGILVSSQPCPADFDGDCDVDEGDFSAFEACATGPALGPPAPGCADKDFDGDDDVDQADFAVFQRCISGEDQVADPHCAP